MLDDVSKAGTRLIAMLLTHVGCHPYFNVFKGRQPRLFWLSYMMITLCWGPAFERRLTCKCTPDPDYSHWMTSLQIKRLLGSLCLCRPLAGNRISVKGRLWNWKISNPISSNVNCSNPPKRKFHSTLIKWFIRIQLLLFEKWKGKNSEMLCVSSCIAKERNHDDFVSFSFNEHKINLCM